MSSHDEAATESEVPSGVHRRRLIQATAGGMVLAASGLLLPDWLNEAEAADNHPVRGVQERKTQRRRFENLNKKGSTQSTFTNDTEELHAGILFPGEKNPFVWLENPFAGTPNTTYQSGGVRSPPSATRVGPRLSITEPWRRGRKPPIALTSRAREPTRSRFGARLTSLGSSPSR